MKKKWLRAAACAAVLCACSLPVGAFGGEPAAEKTSPAEGPQVTEVQKTAPDTSADEAVVLTDPAVGMAHPEKYYLTEGSTYEKTTGLIESIDREKTGLPQRKSSYYYRVERNLTGKYLYSVKAYDADSHVLIGNYFVAKDESSVWKLNGQDDVALIFGTPDNLLEQTEVVVYPSKLSMGSYGILRVHVPGRLPYDIKVTSLNPSVADISEKMNIVPKEEGKADLIIDVRIGSSVKTFTKTVKVIDRADKFDGGSGRRPIGIGIGVGWGGGWHHHGHGGVDIWV